MHTLDDSQNLTHRKTSRARLTAKRLGIIADPPQPTLPSVEQEATDSY